MGFLVELFGLHTTPSMFGCCGVSLEVEQRTFCMGSRRVELISACQEVLNEFGLKELNEVALHSKSNTTPQACTTSGKALVDVDSL